MRAVIRNRPITGMVMFLFLLAYSTKYSLLAHFLFIFLMVGILCIFSFCLLTMMEACMGSETLPRLRKSFFKRPEFLVNKNTH